MLITLMQFKPPSLNFPVAGMTLLFLTYLTLSVVWSDNDQNFFHTLIEALLVLTFCLAIPISIARFSGFLNLVVNLSIMASAINCAYSIYLHYALPQYQPLPEPRLYALGRLSNPVIGALSYGFAIILSSYMLLIEKTPISIKLSDGRNLGLSPKLKSSKTEKVNDITEITIPNKDKVVNDKYSELILSFSMNYQVIFRAYNEGFAYRFIDLDKKLFSSSRKNGLSF